MKVEGLYSREGREVVPKRVREGPEVVPKRKPMGSVQKKTPVVSVMNLYLENKAHAYE